MIGSYFDNIWLYIKNIRNVYNWDNDIKNSIPNGLLYDILKNFGFEIENLSMFDKIL